MSGVIYETPEGEFYTIDGWLTGDGDYAGHTFFLQEDRDVQGSPSRVLHSVIYKSQPPIE